MEIKEKPRACCSPMWRARKSARHLEDQVTPILCVRLSPWEHRFTKLESRRGGAAHSPQNTRKQLHPTRQSPPPAAPASPPLPPPSSSALFSRVASWLRAALPLRCAALCALTAFYASRQKKEQGGRKPLPHPPSIPPSLHPSIPPSIAFIFCAFIVLSLFNFTHFWEEKCLI